MLPFFEKKDTNLFIYEYRNFSFPAHIHPSLEVILAQKGRIILNIEGTSHKLQEGQLGIIFPGKIHSYTLSGEGNGHIFLLSPSLLGSYKKYIDKKEPENCIVTAINPDAFLALERLKGAMNKSLDMQKAYSKLFLYCLFEALPLCPAKEKTDMLSLVVDYMERNFTDKITLDTLAVKLYTSKYTLSRLFNNTLQTSFSTYLNTLRVHHATELMESGKTISESAFDSGFENLRTFNRAFKSIMGTCPKEYLRKNPADTF